MQQVSRADRLSCAAGCGDHHTIRRYHFLCRQHATAAPAALSCHSAIASDRSESWSQGGRRERRPILLMNWWSSSSSRRDSGAQSSSENVYDGSEVPRFLPASTTTTARAESAHLRTRPTRRSRRSILGATATC